MSAARLRRRLARREAQAGQPGHQPSSKVTDAMRVVAAIASYLENFPAPQRSRLVDAIR